MTRDVHVVGIHPAAPPGPADVARDGRAAGTGGAALTGTPGGPTTARREGRGR